MRRVLVLVGALTLAYVAMFVIAARVTPAAGDMPTMGAIVATASRSPYVLPLPGETLRPPARYIGETRAVLEVIEPEKVEATCAAGGPGALACTKMYPKRPTIVMPDPCAFPFDSYAAMLCHEIAHVNGWDHGRGL